MRTLKTFIEFPPAEQQEFQDCCERLWYNRKEFEVTELETDDNLRTVTVTREDRQRRYQVSDERNWLADFEDDLTRGHFGAP